MYKEPVSSLTVPEMYINYGMDCYSFNMYQTFERLQVTVIDCKVNKAINVRPLGCY